MTKKDYSKYEILKDKKVEESAIDIFIEENQQEILKKAEEKKAKLYKHRYNYKEFRKDNTYSFENFNNCTGEKNNPMKLSNYEQIGFNDYRLIVPKLLMQALGTKEAVYLAELARFSILKPVNDYGFYLVSKYEIEKDTGLTARQQDPLCKKLETLGVIETVTYKKQQRKFYRFNDDFTLELYYKFYKKTFARTKYRA